jgi:diadenosine tetraphosphate (Ap4A) HIT family hydrolase
VPNSSSTPNSISDTASARVFFPMPNSTLEKFGYPQTLIRGYDHWCVLLRTGQVTLGSLILGSTGEARSFSQIPPQAFAELATVTRHIEEGLKSFRPYDKINYLMLMMVDPHVHFHVVPRYREAQAFRGLTIPDKGWPAAPDLASAMTLPADQFTALHETIRAAWPRD